MNGDGLSSLLEEDAVVADAEAKKTFEFARQGLDPAGAAFRVTVNGFENRHGDMLWDGAELSRNFRLEVDLLHNWKLFLARGVAADLFHGKAQFGDHLFEGDALASVAKVFAGGA